VSRIIGEIKEANKAYKVSLNGIDAVLGCFKPRPKEET
jgi:hypothetical protein